MISQKWAEPVALAQGAKLCLKQNIRELTQAEMQSVAGGGKGGPRDRGRGDQERGRRGILIAIGG